MKHIYQKHQLLTQLTIDDLLISENVSHVKYRNWLVENGHPLYKMTRGMYNEAILLDDPRYTMKLSRSEGNKVLYSKGWIEPRVNKTADIIDMLKEDLQLPQDYIAMTLGVTQARVSQVATQNNLRPKRKKRSTVTKEQVRELSHLHAKEIADRLNICVSTVYKKL